MSGGVNAAAAAIFTPDGQSPRPGARLRNPDLARTLQAIAVDGRAGFYEGATARLLADFARQQGGFFDESDLRQQSASWDTPISGSYRGVTVYETPPPTQGFCVLEMLNLLEPYGVGGWDFLGADHVHHLVQTKQIAYNDRDQLLARVARLVREHEKTTA